jgi:hypothetical protein
VPYPSNHSRAPAPPVGVTATQLDLSLGDHRRQPPQQTAPAQRRSSRRLNAVPVPKEVMSVWLTPHPLGSHPDAQRFEKLRRRHGDCPELQSEFTADGRLRLRCVACRTEARFRLPGTS